MNAYILFRPSSTPFVFPSKLTALSLDMFDLHVKIESRVTEIGLPTYLAQEVSLNHISIGILKLLC